MPASLDDLLARLDEDTAQSVRSYLAAPQPPSDWPATEKMLRHAEALLRASSGGGKEGAGAAALLHEKMAAAKPAWRETVFLLGRAVVLYNRATDLAAALRCHRRLRRAAPPDLPPRQAMALWRPAGVALAYAASGHAGEALESTAERAAKVTQWSVWERFQLHMLRGRLYLEQGEAERAADEGRRYTLWGTALAPDDPALHLGNVSADGAVDFDIHSDAGRWYCVCELFALIVVRAATAAGGPTQPALDEMQRHLDSYEAGWQAARERADAKTDTDWQKAAEDFRKGVGAAHGFAGWVACEAGAYALCVAWLRRQEEILGALYAEGPLYLAAALLALGQKDAALAALALVDEGQTQDGRARAFVAARPEFAPLRHDAAFRQITASWR